MPFLDLLLLSHSGFISTTVLPLLLEVIVEIRLSWNRMLFSFWDNIKGSTVSTCDEVYLQLESPGSSSQNPDGCGTACQRLHGAKPVSQNMWYLWLSYQWIQSFSAWGYRQQIFSLNFESDTFLLSPHFPVQILNSHWISDAICGPHLQGTLSLSP